MSAVPLPATIPLALVDPPALMLLTRIHAAGATADAGVEVLRTGCGENHRVGGHARTVGRCAAGGGGVDGDELRRALGAVGPARSQDSRFSFELHDRAIR